MYAAVDSREVRGQAGTSHNRHQASLTPPGRFPLADWEQSPGAEVQPSEVWGRTPQPQHPLWLCPLVLGGCLHPSHPSLQLGHGLKSGETPETSPLLRCTTLKRAASCVPEPPVSLSPASQLQPGTHTGLPPNPGYSWGQARSSQLQFRGLKSPLCLLSSAPEGSSFTLL